MNKLTLLAALPFALGVAACDKTPEAADGTATDAAVVAASDDAMAADTSVVGPTDTKPGAAATDTMSAKALDTTAENLEKQADAVEPTNEVEADRLEAQAKALQEKRDAKD
jgi:hypothetical protein